LVVLVQEQRELRGLQMLTRRFLILVAMLGSSGVALAQENAAPAATAPQPAATQAAPVQPVAPTDLRATAAYPERQDASQWLGLNLIGAKVVSANGETVGRIANLIVDENGTIASVVIEVGGLLGVGGKSVAVTYQSMQIARSKAGDAIDHVTIAATKDDLLRVAAFKSLRQQIADAQGKRN
jgi:hypothetical protein